jgi:cobalt/nickel transport system permease protein
MPGPIDHLPCTQSALGQWDPRWKLAALTIACVVVLLLQDLTAAGIALLGAVALALFGRLPWRWCLARLGLMLMVLAPFLILLPFVQRQSEDAWQLGPLRFSPIGVLAALRLAIKSVSVVLLVLVLLATAPLPTSFKAAQCLHVPGLIVQLANMAYRYVFVLAGELARLRVALRVRGYRNRPTLHCYRTAGHVAGTLLVRGYEQAERVEQAMRCRGFDGRFRSLNEFATRTIDVVAFLFVLLCSSAVLCLDLASRN